MKLESSTTTMMVGFGRKAKMKLYIVFGSISGFARGDRDEPVVYGAFTDEMTARKVRIVTHGKIKEVELDKVAPGYLSAIKELFTN